MNYECYKYMMTYPVAKVYLEQGEEISKEDIPKGYEITDVEANWAGADVVIYPIKKGEPQ